MEEIWKPIAGYEGSYEVSSLGRVKSLNYNHTGIEMIIRPLNRPDGYKTVSLCVYGNPVHYRIHRLVAQAFIPNPDNLPQVNHKDEDKSNNRVDNLEWCTEKYNSNYGTGKQRRNDKLVNGKKSKKINQYTTDGDFIREWISMNEIKRQLGYNTGPICNCCKGIVHKAYGYKWNYTM